MPGDVPDFQSLYLEVLDITIATISSCRLGFVQHDAVRALLREHPRLNAVFWRATLIDAALVREWMLNTGRREAYARMAHLFCELVTRLDAVGLAPDRTCDLPMTQPELADALGITPVHVNRTIRDLKAAGLVSAARPPPRGSRLAWAAGGRRIRSDLPAPAGSGTPLKRPLEACHERRTIFGSAGCTRVAFQAADASCDA
ncbi:Crp/Fnr family transcriptional regulator [Methylobacterium phyllosphaerae]